MPVNGNSVPKHRECHSRTLGIRFPTGREHNSQWNLHTTESITQKANRYKTWGTMREKRMLSLKDLSNEPTILMERQDSIFPSISDTFYGRGNTIGTSSN